MFYNAFKEGTMQTVRDQSHHKVQTDSCDANDHFDNLVTN